MHYCGKVALLRKTEVCGQSIRKISIQQQTMWHLIGNASISWKTHIGEIVNELTMSDIKRVPIETKETSYCESVHFQLSNTWKRTKENISMKMHFKSGA